MSKQLGFLTPAKLECILREVKHNEISLPLQACKPAKSKALAVMGFVPINRINWYQQHVELEFLHVQIQEPATCSGKLGKSREN